MVTMETLMVIAPMFVLLVGWFVLGKLIPLAWKDSNDESNEKDS